MIRVLHLLDGTCGWEQAVAIRQLLGSSETARSGCRIAGIGRAPPSWSQSDTPDHIIRGSSRFSLLGAALLDRYVRKHGIEVVYAWGPAALLTAATLQSNQRLLVVVFDPGVPESYVRKIRTACRSSRAAVICSAERVRRRLVEQGVPFDACVVIRPAVDFALIRATDDARIRADLGVADHDRMFVMPPPLAGRDGHRAALWAVIMRAYLDEPVRLIVTGTGPEVARLWELSHASGQQQYIVFAEERFPFERLCAVADDLLLGDIEGIPMTAAAWAMAANTLITAPATYATTETLANDLNARLFKAPENWRQRATKLAATLDPDPASIKIREVARGQAYEVFSLRRFNQQHARVIDNLLAGHPPADGITDPALVGAA